MGKGFIKVVWIGFGGVTGESRGHQLKEVIPLRVAVYRKYGRPRSRPHLIYHIFGARITLILLFCKTVLLSGAFKNTIGRVDLPKMKR